MGERSKPRAHLGVGENAANMSDLSHIVNIRSQHGFTALG